MGDDRGVRDRRRRLLPRRTPRGSRTRPAGDLPGRAPLRHGSDLGLRARLHVRARNPAPRAALLSGRRGRSSLRPARRTADAGSPGADPPGHGMVAERPLRASGVHGRPHHVPARPPVRDGRDHRLARQPAGAGGCGRAGARLGSRSAARPPRTPSRPARRREPLRPGARLVAPGRGGVPRLHPRAARPDPVRPDGDRARRRRRRPCDRRGRRGRRDRVPSRHETARGGLSCCTRSPRADGSSTART